MRGTNERGQALLLAVIGLVVLAIGMYTTYSISRSVYEKIQLQNAADATAYSLATFEARSMNLIAFTNRAQIANYVQMMEAQAVLSNLTFLEGVAGHGGDILLISGNYLERVGDMGTLSLPLKEAGEKFHILYDQVRPVVTDLDRWEPSYIQMQTTKNNLLFAVTAAYVLATAIRVSDGGDDIITANDPDARTNQASNVLNAINLLSYVNTFDPSSFSKELGEPGDRERAKRIMTELTNASRFSTFGGDNKDFLLARDVFDSLSGPLAALKDKSFLGKMAKAGEVVNGVLSEDFIGTAKMIANKENLAKLGQPVPEMDGLADLLADTEKREPDKSFLNPGGVMVAKDQSKILNDFMKWDKGFASVISSPDGGSHCRYVGPPTGMYGSPTRISEITQPPKIDCKDNKHKWKGFLGMKGGIAPFITFAPKLQGIAAEPTNFNQPDVWILLEKTPASMGLRQHNTDPDMKFSVGADSATFSPAIGGNGIMGGGAGRGMYAIARAQVYYHRAGAWQEMPNYFNPFWGSRLAPKGALVRRVLANAGIPGDWSQLVTDNVWMQ